MICIADGPSDVPMFSILNQFGGRTLGVYNPNQEEHYKEVKKLRDQGRVQHFVGADYTKGLGAFLWIMTSLKEIAQQIIVDRERALIDRVKPSGKHVI